LNHRRSISHPAADPHIVNLQPDEITAPEFAVDGEVEQGQVTPPPFQPEPDPYGPDILGLQWPFLTDQGAPFSKARAADAPPSGSR
jgi:hypothetical protein